ncbi:MAG: hypothetical protein ACQET8_17085 [Bacillota bacterium]
MSDQVNLLNPSNYVQVNYIHQLQQTINAYSRVLIVLGEAVQNALDAVCDLPNGVTKGKIEVLLDLDSNKIIVKDNGKGFPEDVSLLFLGGTRKNGVKLKGKVGVGIKVTLFSSDIFSIRSRTEEKAWKLEVKEARNFASLSEISIPVSLPDDPQPLESNGTEITYVLPQREIDELINQIVGESLNEQNLSAGFGTVIENELFPSPIATLISSYFRRNTYVGDVLAQFNEQSNFPPEGIDIEVKIKSNNLQERFPEQIVNLFGSQPEQTFYINPTYLTVDETVDLIPRGRRKPTIFHDRLGPGGSALVRTDGFNTITLTQINEFEELLRDQRGNLPSSVEKFNQRLFPNINAIYIAIGRIPEFNKFLPGGSKRQLSCNGVITSHSIDFTSGRNQEYVRCIDLVVDLDADLNYGKTHITNSHLVKLVKEYINEVYSRTLQKATGTFVGKLVSHDDEDDQIYTGRVDLGIDELITRKTPNDENDVIALFFELAGKGLFNDYRFFGLSQSARYDGKGVIVRPADRGNSATILNPQDDSRLRNIEFKLFARDLVKDFDRNQKFASEVPIVIAWDMGTYESQQYGVYDIEDSNAYSASPQKVFPYTTKYIYDTRGIAEVQILLLKDIVEKIRNGTITFTMNTQETVQ